MFAPFGGSQWHSGLLGMLKVGFNGWFLERPETGTGQYSRKILDALTTRAEVKVLALGGRQLPAGKALLNIYKVWFENALFPLFCLREHVDVAFVPYMGPPLFSPKPLVVTVHDLIPFLFPEYAYSPLVKLYNFLVKAAIPKACLILADSAHTRKDVIGFFKVSPEKVRVVYPGIGEEFKPVKDEARLRAVRERYGLSGRFFLYLGGFDRRKNIGLLLDAYQILRNKLGNQAPVLVIAGKAPTRESPALLNPLKMVRERGLEDGVKFTGWVADEDKPSLYSMAEAFLFPSLYEGFGFPPLEAMACGCPVLASRSSSLPEVLGEAALLLDPNRPEDWAEGMEMVIKELDLAQSLQEKGVERAKIFTWESAARNVFSILEEAARRGSP